MTVDDAWDELQAAPPTVRQATPADVGLLAALGARTFEEAFGNQNILSDIATYLAANFTPMKLAEELADSSNSFLIAEIDGDAAGYAKLHSGEPSPLSPPRGLWSCRASTRSRSGSVEVSVMR